MGRELTEVERKSIALMYSRCGFDIPTHLLPPTPEVKTDRRGKTVERSGDTW
jgi:hypothetical protein